MPELPEVETLASALRHRIEGFDLIAFKAYRKDLREPMPLDRMSRCLPGRRLLRIHRRSKYMLWDFGQETLLIHLGMSGNLVEEVSNDTIAEPSKHRHLSFYFKPSTADGPQIHLQYVDPRRFGRVAIVGSQVWQQHPFFKDLGPEPLQDDFDLVQHLYDRSRFKRQPLKVFLMDPRNVVGVGNIYASETLWRAKLSPLMPAGELSLKQLKVLVPKIRETLREAIEEGGTSFRDFKHLDGQVGYFAQKLRVYQRAGQPCLRRCQSAIEECRQAGRSTYFCPLCQSYQPSVV